MPARTRQAAFTQRRERQFIISVGNSATLGGTNPLIVNDITAAYEAELALTMSNITVAALYGSFKANSTATQWTGAADLALGMAFIPESMVTAAELPDPLLDDYDWIMHRIWCGMPPSATNQPFWDINGGVVAIENHSSRKQRENHSRLVVIARSNANQSLSVQFSARALFVLT